MSWANSVFPVFKIASGRKPRSMPESAFAVQIDTTLHRSQSRFSHGFQPFNHQFNRTVVKYGMCFTAQLYEVRNPLMFSLQEPSTSLSMRNSNQGHGRQRGF